MRNNKSNKGFTLIELLIVIAIIGILAAVLIPNLLAARSRANDTAVQSYLQQVATTQEMYQIDNNSYASTIAALQGTAYGLRTVPANVTITPGTVDANNYCFHGVHSGGSTGGFNVSPQFGVRPGACE